MSAKRGVEIHNGYVKLTNVAGFQAGLEATPITQGIAGQVVVSAVINAIALGGAVKTGEFIIFATVSLTGVLTALRAKVVVNDGITVTPTGGAHTDTIFGAHIEVDTLGAGVVGGRLEGLRIDISSALGSTTLSAVHGIHISGYNLGTQSVTDYYFLRGQENGTYVVNYCLYFRGGTGGINFFAMLHGNHNAWNALGAPATQSGWIRLMCGGMERWIQLFSVAP